MRRDQKVLSPQVAKEMAEIGYPPAKLSQMLRQEAVEEARQRGIYRSMPFKEPFVVYLRNARRPNARHTGLSDTSYQDYERILAIFYVYCTGQQYDPTRRDKFPITECEFNGRKLINDLQPFLDTMAEVRNLTDRSYNKYVAVLRAFVRDMGDLYDLPKAPMPHFAKTDRPLPRAISDRDVRSLLEIARSSNYGIRAYFMVNFLLGTGLRRNEFLNTQRRHIDFDNPSIHVVKGKGGAARVVPIAHSLMPLIVEYLDLYHITRPSDYLYSQIRDASKSIDPSTLDRQMLRMFQRLDSYDGDDPLHAYTLHSLRHTYATKLLRNHVSLRSISAALGHSSVVTTQIYTVLDVDGLREQLSPALDIMSDWWR